MLKTSAFTAPAPSSDCFSLAIFWASRSGAYNSDFAPFAVGVDDSSFAPSSSLYAAGPGGVTEVGQIGGGASVVGLAAPVGTPIPEPGTVLVGVALCGFIGATRSRRRE